MAKCKNCSRGNWFTSVDSNGLCATCQPIVIPALLNHCRIVLESAKIIAASKNTATKLSRIGVAISNCKALRPYEAKGIPTLDQPLGAVVSEFERMRTELLSEVVQEQVFLARQKATDAATDAGKLGGYAKAVEVLSSLMGEVEDVTPLENAVLGLRAERDGLRFDLLAKKAETAAAKGKTKAAADIYVEALMAIRHDTTPDEMQTQRVSLAERRIKDLNG